ncbi:Kunitz/Bovine pancreatic trypsin inhibitor domain protein, partial [Ancylostoma caninum]
LWSRTSIYLFICLSSDTDNACFLPLAKGNCRAKLIRYGYDQKQNRCVPFAWSGCGGNLNRFKKMHNCELACRV